MADRTERPQRGERDKTQVTPEPARPDFFAWIERLFEGSDQKPERLDLKQAFGPGGRSYSETSILQKEFKVNSAKPTREQMVAISNEFLNAAQNNCNELGKEHRYAALAKNFHKSDTYYECFLVRLSPKQHAGYDPLASDDDLPSDQKRRDEFLQHTLDRLRQSDENRRWEQDLHANMTNNMLARYDSIIDKQALTIEKMQAMYFEMYKAKEEALSQAMERSIKMEDHKFKREMQQEGFQFLKGMLPVAVNKITGKSTLPTTETAESIGFKTFLEGLSDDQSQSLFGEFNEVTKELKPTGIFSPIQAKIFAAFAAGQGSPDSLDQLMSGEHAISQEQVMKAQGVLSMNQFGPLMALVMDMQKKRLEAVKPAENTIATTTNA